MKKITTLTLLVSILVSFQVVYSQTHITGNYISGHWTIAGSPYIIDHIVNTDTIYPFIIDAGVTVMLSQKIQVTGPVIFSGTVDSPIIFKPIDTSGYFDTNNIHYSDFLSISMRTTDTAIINYCQFSYAITAVSVHDYGFIKISNSVISHCKGYSTSALILSADHASIIATNNLIENNINIYGTGGGVTINGLGNITFENNTVRKNRTNLEPIYSFYGGGVYIKKCSNLIFRNNLIAGNQSEFGGGIFIADALEVTLQNNLFLNNKAVRYGGGLYSYLLYRMYNINNTFMGNEAMYGGGFSCGTFMVSYHVNNIVWGNSATQGGSQIFWVGNAGYNTCYNNCIQYDSFGFGYYADYYDGDYQNNIALTPFLNPDYSLQDSSPCVNKGLADTTGFHIAPYDYQFNPRIYGGRIDIGAFENQNMVNAIEPSTQESTFLLYPNPSPSGVFYLKQTETGKLPFTLSIYNINGTRIYHRSSFFPELTLDLSDQPAGVYIAKLQHGNTATTEIYKLMVGVH